MPEPPLPDDPVTTATDALRGGLNRARALAAGLQQNVRERAGEVLRNRLDALRPGGATPSAPAPAPFTPTPIPPPAPDWPVDVRLANGQRGRAVFDPRLVNGRDLAAVARVSAANDRRSFAAIQRQGEELEALKRSHEELSRQVTTLQQSERLLAGLLDGLSGIERSVETVKAQGQRLWQARRADRRLAAQQRQQIKSLAVRSRIDQVTAVVNTVQATAFGQRGSVLATNNLLLAANQLFWTFLDPLLQSFGITSATRPGLVAWLAPLGALATGQAALGDEQHVRFVSGVAEFDGTSRVVLVPLRDHVAPAMWEKLLRGREVVATVTALGKSAATRFAARVSRGVLRIAALPSEGGGGGAELVAVAPPGRVAWMVDLGDDIG